MSWILFYTCPKLNQVSVRYHMIQVVEGVPLPRNLKQNFCHLWQIEKKWFSQDTPDKKVPNYGCCARDIDIHMCMSGLEGAGGQQLPPENCNALAGHQVWCGEGQTPLRSVRQSLCNCLGFGAKRLQTRFWPGAELFRGRIDLFNTDKPDLAAGWLYTLCLGWGRDLPSLEYTLMDVDIFLCPQGSYKPHYSWAYGCLIHCHGIRNTATLLPAKELIS